MKILLASFSNLEPTVMPQIEGGRVYEMFDDRPNSIIQKQVKDLVVSFGEFIKHSFKSGSIKHTKGFKLGLSNFRFEYELRDLDKGIVEIIYVLEGNLLEKQTSEALQDWFTYFIKALDESNAKIHSDSSQFYSHIDERQIKSVRSSLNAIRGMAIENEKLYIKTFGCLESPVFIKSVSDKVNKESETGEDKVVSNLTEDDSLGVQEKNSENDDGNKQCLEGIHDLPEGERASNENVHIFDTQKKPPAYNKEVNPEKGKIDNARVLTQDVENLKIKFKSNNGGPSIEIEHRDVNEQHDFQNRFPNAGKKDCLALDIEYQLESNGKYRLINAEETVHSVSYVGLFGDD